MIIRIVIALVVSTMMHFALGCGGDPCLDADYTTSGMCVHLDGHDLDLTRADIDFIIQQLDPIAEQHGLSDVNMRKTLEDVGPVPLVAVPHGSLGYDPEHSDILIAGCTNYTTFSEWDNLRLGGYTIQLIDGLDRYNTLLTLSHELLHILAPEYLGTTKQVNADHSEPYLFKYWVRYDHDYGAFHTVEGIADIYIREYLGLSNERNR